MIGIVATIATETMAVIIALFILIIYNSVTPRFPLLEDLQVVFAVMSRAAFELRPQRIISDCLIRARVLACITFLPYSLFERYAITSLLDTPLKDAA